MNARVNRVTSVEISVVTSDLSLPVSYVWVDFSLPYHPLLFSKTCLKSVSGQGLPSGRLCLSLTEIVSEIAEQNLTQISA